MRLAALEINPNARRRRQYFAAISFRLRPVDTGERCIKRFCFQSKLRQQRRQPDLLPGTEITAQEHVAATENRS